MDPEFDTHRRTALTDGFDAVSDTDLSPTMDGEQVLFVEAGWEFWVDMFIEEKSRHSDVSGRVRVGTFGASDLIPEPVERSVTPSFDTAYLSRVGNEYIREFIRHG